MYNLSNPKIVKELMKESGVSFKKSLGQNFLINPTVCPKMAQEACPNKDYGVIEIGPGIGVLTAELAKRARKVVAIELDSGLKTILEKTLVEFDNVELVFADVMKIDLKRLIQQEFSNMKVCVCANLPYYITSPVIMHLLESDLPIESIIVMVQKEAADRICAKVGTRQAGAISVAVNYRSIPKENFKVSKGSFLPVPKVDSQVITLQLRKKPPVVVNNEQHFFKFVKACFSQRRKTLANAVSSSLGIDKKVVIEALIYCEISPDIRAESTSMQQLADIFNRL